MQTNLSFFKLSLLQESLNIGFVHVIMDQECYRSWIVWGSSFLSMSLKSYKSPRSILLHPKSPPWKYKYCPFSSNRETMIVVCFLSPMLWKYALGIIQRMFCTIKSRWGVISMNVFKAGYQLGFPKCHKGRKPYLGQWESCKRKNYFVIAWCLKNTIRWWCDLCIYIIGGTIVLDT